ARPLPAHSAATDWRSAEAPRPEAAGRHRGFVLWVAAGVVPDCLWVWSEEEMPAFQSAFAQSPADWPAVRSKDDARPARRTAGSTATTELREIRPASAPAHDPVKKIRRPMPTMPCQEMNYCLPWHLVVRTRPDIAR